MKTHRPLRRTLALCLALFAAHACAALAQVVGVPRYEPDEADRRLLAGANERIARYRQGPLVVRVLDRRGLPVADASVRVEQTRHAFLFGSNIFRLAPQDHAPAQLAYQERFAALFNYATLPFYWGMFERVQGQPDYARLEAMARWCDARGIKPKGHPLVWQEVYPRWAPKDADSVVPLLHKRVSNLITHYRGLVHIWDVVNEANAAAQFDNGVGDWVKRDGAATEVSTALSWARAAGEGDETFIYNDYEIGPKNVALLSELRAANSLPDVVGIQSHMHQGVWPLARVWETCETFARFGRPIHFTEVTVLSGGTRTGINYHGPAATDWKTTPEGEARQAAYVADFYTLLFSHPSVRAITWWDLSDGQGAWLGAPAGLLRADMTPKPAYERLLRLIKHDWWTDAAGRTDRRGDYTTRAFLGSYRITVAASGRARAVNAEVTRNEEAQNVVTVHL